MSLPPLLSFSNMSPQPYSLLHTHHPLNSLLYQLYTLPTPCNPYKSILHYSRGNTL
jgi:hypothetical protein